MNEDKTLGSDVAAPMIFPTKDFYHCERGLTKREYFAAMAMQGLLAGQCYKDPDSLTAIEIADALIAALNETT